MRFGIEDHFVEIQSLGRGEEEVKIFECLGQDEALHFIALLLGHDISKRIFAPAISPAPCVVVGEVAPGISRLRIVLSNGRPLPLRQIRPHRFQSAVRAASALMRSFSTGVLMRSEYAGVRW